MLEPKVVQEQVELALARKSFQDFCKYTDPSYIELPHTRMLCAHLQALADNEIRFLMIFMPPRHGKTYHASEKFPAFYEGIEEGVADVIIGSYTQRRANASSFKVREIFRDESWPFADVAIDPDSQAVNEWRTTRGGLVMATGVGGSSSGFGANLLAIDDPIKGRKEANSETYRESQWEWYTEVAARRLQSNLKSSKRTPAKQLICTTRWTEDDICGRILNSGAANKWTILRLPAIAEDNDPLGRPKGAELAPELGVEIPRPDLGEISLRGFEALYQGNPTPLEGGLFKRAWFARRWKELPTLKRAVIYLDGAWKEGVSNDRSALALWATDGIDYYLVDAWADRVEYPDLKTKARDFWNKWRDAKIAPSLVFAVEDAASGIPLVQEFRRTTNIPIVGVTVDKSKFTRAEAVSGLFEARKCVLPEDAPWLDSWIEEHIRFDGLGGKTTKAAASSMMVDLGTHDDYVDTTSGALARLAYASTLSWGVAHNRKR